MAKVGTGYDLEKDKASLTDLCVSCGVDTGIPKDMPVDERPFLYTDGGQLCGPCDREIYGPQP